MVNWPQGAQEKSTDAHLLVGPAGVCPFYDEGLRGLRGFLRVPTRYTVFTGHQLGARQWVRYEEVQS